MPAKPIKAAKSRRRRIEAPTPEQKPKYKAPTAKERRHSEALGQSQIGMVIQGMVKRSVAAWFETFGRIRDKEGQVIKPQPNILQQRFWAVVKYCRQHALACRIIVLKPRQKGSSTMSVADQHHELLRAEEEGRIMEARIMGGQYDQCANLWGIARTYHALDACEWANGADFNANEATFGGGSRSKWETARNPDAGRSGTIMHAIVTELGRWRTEGVASAKKVLSGFLNCVPDRAGTTVVIESTAQGAEGEFYERWENGISFDDLKAGKRGFVQVFAAWFEFDDSVPQYEVTPKLLEELRATLSDEEDRLIAEFHVTDLQLLWRRDTIRDDFNGDDALFRQEFPSTPEEAFLLSGNPRFAKSGLAVQKAIAKSAEKAMGEYGSIDVEGMPEGYTLGQPGAPTPTAVTWRPGAPKLSDEFSLYRRWEPPIENREYIIVVDTMTGVAQAMGEDPDCHSVLCLRRGYWEEIAGATEMNWRRHALAARVVSEKGHECRMEVAELAPVVWRLARLYGNCPIVVEMNKGTDLIELLRLMPGVRLYQREVFNEREKKNQKAYGWNTTIQTRPMVIDRIAGAISRMNEPGEGIDIRCEAAVQQCAHFVMNASGRAEAASGWYDDDVMALGIGLQTITHATAYALPRIARAVPEDVRRIQAKQQNQTGVGRSQYS